MKKLGKQIEAFEQNYLEDTMYYGYDRTTDSVVQRVFIIFETGMLYRDGPQMDSEMLRKTRRNQRK